VIDLTTQEVNSLAMQAPTIAFLEVSPLVIGRQRKGSLFVAMQHQMRSNQSIHH
jgi:hypothetical protein